MWQLFIASFCDQTDIEGKWQNNNNMTKVKKLKQDCLSLKNDSVNCSNFMESEWTFEPSIGSRACTCGQKLWYRYLCPSIHSSPYNALCVFHVMGMHYDRVTVIGKTGRTTVLPIFGGYKNKTFLFNMPSTENPITVVPWCQ